MVNQFAYRRNCKARAVLLENLGLLTTVIQFKAYLPTNFEHLLTVLNTQVVLTCQIVLLTGEGLLSSLPRRE